MVQSGFAGFTIAFSLFRIKRQAEQLRKKAKAINMSFAGKQLWFKAVLPDLQLLFPCSILTGLLQNNLQFV